MALSLFRPAEPVLPAAPFRSEAFPLRNGKPGCIYIQAYPTEGGFGLMQVIERPGDLVSQSPASVRIRSYDDQAMSVIGFEMLERMQGREPVAGGDAAALGEAHVRQYLAQRGWLVDEDGRLHGAALPAGAAGRFTRAAIAAVRPVAALPAPVTTPAAPAGEPSLAGLETWLDLSVVGKRGQLLHGLPLRQRMALAGSWSRTLSPYHRLRAEMESAPQDSSVFALAHTLRHRPSELTPARLAVIAVEALDCAHFRLAGAAVASGADFTCLGPPHLQDYEARGVRIAGLFASAGPAVPAALLEAGMPPQAGLSTALLAQSLRLGHGPVLDVLAPGRDLRAELCADEMLLLNTLASDRSLRWLVRSGIALDSLSMPQRSGSLAEILVQLGKPEQLRIAHRHGLSLTAASGAPVLMPAIQRGQDRCVDLLLDEQFPALDAPARGLAMEAALVAGRGDWAARMLARDPSTLSGLLSPDGLEALHRHKLPQLWEALERQPGAIPALFGGLLAAPGAAATQILTTAIAGDSRAVREAVAAHAEALQPLLLAHGHEAAACAVLAHPGQAATLLQQGLAAEGQGCPLSAAVARRQPALIAALFAAGAAPAADLLHRTVASRADLPTLTALAKGLPASVLDAPDAAGDTAVLTAARDRDLERVCVLLAAGADPDIAGRDGRKLDAVLPRQCEALLNEARRNLYWKRHDARRYGTPRR